MKLAWRKQTTNSEPRPVWRTSGHAHGVCFGILQISATNSSFPRLGSSVTWKQSCSSRTTPCQSDLVRSVCLQLTSVQTLTRTRLPALASLRHLETFLILGSLWDAGNMWQAHAYLLIPIWDLKPLRQASVSYAGCCQLPGLPVDSFQVRQGKHWKSVAQSRVQSQVLCVLWGFWVQFWLSHGTF